MEWTPSAHTRIGIFGCEAFLPEPGACPDRLAPTAFSADGPAAVVHYTDTQGAELPDVAATIETTTSPRGPAFLIRVPSLEGEINVRVSRTDRPCHLAEAIEVAARVLVEHMRALIWPADARKPAHFNCLAAA